MAIFWYNLENDDKPVNRGASLANVDVTKFVLTFFKSTNLQGFPQLIRQPGIIKKFLWLVAIIFVGFLLYLELHVR